MDSNKIIQKQELDLELFYLSRVIESVRGGNYSKEITKQIDELYWLIDSTLYEKIPSGYDIVDDKCILITHFKKFNNRGF